MRIAFILAALFVFTGCTPVPHQPSGYGVIQSTQTLPITIDKNRASLREKRQQLSQAHQQDEIDRLKKEIEDLEARIAELEQQDRELKTTPNAVNPYGMPGTGGAVHTGPRGGRYTISPSGKKQYLRRRK